MAIIVGAFGGGSIKGKLSGNVFQGSKAGQLIRNWVKPVDPSAPGQVVTRLAMQQAMNRWVHELTPAERQSWEDYAAGTPIPSRFGTPHVTSGQQMFIRTNVARTLGGVGTVDQAPPTPGIATSPVPTITLSEADGIEVASLSDPIPVGGQIFISLSIPVSPTRNFYKSPFRTGSVIISTTTFPHVIKAAGADLVEGQRYFARYRYYAPDGKVSNVTIINLGEVGA